MLVKHKKELRWKDSPEKESNFYEKLCCRGGSFPHKKGVIFKGGGFPPKKMKKTEVETFPEKKD